MGKLAHCQMGCTWPCRMGSARYTARCQTCIQKKCQATWGGCMHGNKLDCPACKGSLAETDVKEGFDDPAVGAEEEPHEGDLEEGPTAEALLAAKQMKTVCNEDDNFIENMYKCTKSSMGNEAKATKCFAGIRGKSDNCAKCMGKLAHCQMGCTWPCRMGSARYTARCQTCIQKKCQATWGGCMHGNKLDCPACKGSLAETDAEEEFDEIRVGAEEEPHEGDLEVRPTAEALLAAQQMKTVCNEDDKFIENMYKCTKSSMGNEAKATKCFAGIRGK